MTQHATSTQAISVEEWRLVALDKRRQGKNFRQISAELTAEGGPTSLSRAYELVVEALNEIREQCRETAGEIREIEVQRCDLMIETLMRRLTSTGAGENAARPVSSRIAARLVDSIIRVQDRKARYLALDAPKRIEASGAGGAPLLPPGAIAIRLVAPGQAVEIPSPAAEVPAMDTSAEERAAVDAVPPPRPDEPPPPYK